MKAINLEKAMKAYVNWKAEEDYKTVFKLKSEENYKTVSAPIDEIVTKEQGKATVRTIKLLDILYSLQNIEKALGISKKAMNGIHVVCDANAQSFPNAYKYTPESTTFEADYKNGHWVLTDVYRATCKSPSNAVYVRHTGNSEQAIIDRLTYFSI